MWVAKCRGTFRCGSSTVHCGQPGFSTGNCSCEGREYTTVHTRPPVGAALAVLLRGDIRGSEADGVECALSIERHIVQPTNSSVFLTVYDEHRAVGERFAAAFVTGRIVSFTHSSRRTQFDNMFLLLRILSEYEAAHAVSFPSILIVRKDLAFKQSLRPFLLDTRLYSDDGEVEHGVAFAWREINGEWRLFSTQRVSKETLARNKRTPDTLHLVSRSFLPMWRMVVANRSNWNALHEVLTSRARSLLEPRESIVRYLVRGAFDSNPDRILASPNPLYNFLPRNRWQMEAGLCQTRADFAEDPSSGWACCPSPENCCPAALGDCTSPEAQLYDNPSPHPALLAHYRSRSPVVCVAANGGKPRCSMNDAACFARQCKYAVTNRTLEAMLAAPGFRAAVSSAHRY